MPPKPRKTNKDGVPVIPKNYVTETDRRAVAEAQPEITKAYIKHAAADFLIFARGLKIHSAGGPRVFENCMAGFQRECFEDVAPNLQALRIGDMPDMRRFWIERTKKASKDADLAVMLMWLMAFPLRPFYAQVGAADRDQAAIVKERMIRLLHYNTWLNEYVEVVQWEVRSKKTLADGVTPMAKLQIMASDIGGAHGGTPELLVLNELSHVVKWEFIENLMSNAAGVPQGVVIVATNAGVKGTKPEVWRKNALTSESWSCWMLSKPAPWHSQTDVEDERSRLTRSQFRRLWLGEWVSGKGDALDEEEINHCFDGTVKGPGTSPEPGWRYLIGLDIGINKDHSGAVVLGVSDKQRLIKLVDMRAWSPKDYGGEVNLEDVMDWCRIQGRHWRGVLHYDPHQAKLMAQQLRRDMPCVEMTFSRPSNRVAMATSFIQVMQNRLLKCYDDEEGRVRRDFGKFNIVETPSGLKLEAVSDEYGHADVGTALVICLPAAVEMLNGAVGLQPDDVLADPDAEPLTEDEEKDLPDEFRELFEVEEDIKERARLKKRYDPLADLN